MHGFLMENGGIVTEECAQYQTRTKGISCGDFAQCKPVASVAKTYKLKNPTELSIQQELLRNGAVITDWLAPPSMRNYQGGMFGQSDGMSLAQVSGDGDNQQLPNHASIIIGWGQDTSGKYWIVRNSFGESFGMKGDMHIPRGNNAFQVESDIVGFDPVLI